MPQGHSLPAVQSLGPPGGPRGASPAREPRWGEAALLGRSLPPAATLQRAGTKGQEPSQERGASLGGSAAGAASAGLCRPVPLCLRAAEGGRALRNPRRPQGAAPAGSLPPGPKGRSRCPRGQRRERCRHHLPTRAAAVRPRGGARSRRRGGAGAGPPRALRHGPRAAPVAAMMLRRLPRAPAPPPLPRSLPQPAAAAARSVATAVPLAHVEVEGRRDRPPLVLLHGLFGSHSNFQTVAKTLVRRGSGKVLTVDARNHGSSPHSPVMTYEAMSLDVQHLLSRLGITKCILVGHSMGGKTAMTLALQQPDLVERLISVDIGPGSTAPVSEFSAYISAMKEVKVPVGLSRSAARQLADDQLQPVVKLPQLRQFLLTNLVEVEGRYVWRVNLEAISRHLADIMNFPIFHKPYPGPALFLGGSDSPYISSRDYPEIQRLFPKAEIQYIKGAGHIVHQDKFEEFITAVLNFLPQL
ncbi:PREDICTED: alpha/beta hydrolase domain-containing protein 11 [Pseudopodoces humilis]|uniref:alpha/beta hydrolase domain-containing protein 11 n=1 Tax=Pseudopodoces humilis TaxID=181119 RepID=UPI00039586D2|nr:PREDICTED: alpha/beta hydrolase domain-containing protein 11 [Pseudopodoces humilis]